MRLAGEVESKIVELRGGRISSRSDGWARDSTRAMVGVALGEHSNIKVLRALRKAGPRPESRDLGWAIQRSKDGNPSIRRRQRTRKSTPGGPFQRSKGHDRRGPTIKRTMSDNAILSDRQTRRRPRRFAARRLAKSAATAHRPAC